MTTTQELFEQYYSLNDLDYKTEKLEKDEEESVPVDTAALKRRFNIQDHDVQL